MGKVVIIERGSSMEDFWGFYKKASESIVPHRGRRKYHDLEGEGGRSEYKAVRGKGDIHARKGGTPISGEVF